MEQILKGTLYIILGALMYGVLASLVKIGHQYHIHTAVLSTAQFVIGLIVLVFIHQIAKRMASTSLKTKLTLSVKGKIQCVFFGLSLGLTGALYYKALETLTVPQGIILLMQSIWMSVLLESILHRRLPSTMKWIGSIGTLIGTVMVSNILYEPKDLDLVGSVYGFLASIAFTISLYASAHIQVTKHTLVRSLYFVLGGTIATLLFWNIDLVHTQHIQTQHLWILILLAICGTVIPPLVMSVGFPLVGLGIGAIVSALEIPFTMIISSLWIGEQIVILQWVGVVIMLASVVSINWKKV